MDQEAIVAALRENGIKQRGVARLLGISEDKVSKSYKGPDIRRFTAEEVQILLRFLGIAESETPIPKLPIIGLVPAGNWREAIRRPMGWMPKPAESISDKAFVVRVEGDSMDQVAPAGTHLVVDPDDRQMVNKKYYIVRNGDDVTFKQYLSEPSATLMPLSSNKAHKPIIVGEQPFEIVGRVIMKAEWL